jgi:hypothetical protein
MKIQLPDKCPVCGAERMDIPQSENMAYYLCKTELYTTVYNQIENIYEIDISIDGNCADKVLIKFGTTETTGYEEKG